MAIFNGTPNNDILIGTRWDDEIHGWAGDDVLRGRKGHDLLDGGLDHDTLIGGRGNDRLWGRGGDDLLKGGAGKDRLKGGAGEDTLLGGNGADKLKGGAGSDRLFGGNGDDKLFGGKGDDLLDGGKGDDILTGGNGADVFVFKSCYGYDTITDFEIGVDTIRLDDSLWGGSLSILEVIDTYAEVINGDVVFDFGKEQLTLEGLGTLDALKTGAVVRDQGQIFNTDGLVELNTHYFTQSVTMGVSGGLAAIQVQYALPLSEIHPVTFSIYEGGNPATGELLYSEVITSPELDEDGVFEWVLPSEDLQFEVGDEFIFAFEASQSGVFFAASDPPDYPGGELYENGVPSTEVGDLAFITYVDTGALEII